MGRLDLELIPSAGTSGQVLTKTPSGMAWQELPDTLLSAKTGDIGIPGTAGFGVGICPPANLPSGFTSLSGYTDPTSPNYGNYQYADGSVMVFVPKFYYKIGTGANGLAVNVGQIKPASAYANTAAANADGFALHQAFIDGGVEQVGVFVDKYKNSKNAWGTGFICSSIKNALPLSTAAAHNPMSDLTAAGGVNAYYKTIDCAHARDGVNGAVNANSRFFVNSRFVQSALALLAMAHGQASSNTAWCAWYDATYNYPKGCNNNALRDTDDASVLYATDGYSNCGKTGSGSRFAKTTHNGQDCGIADLNGLMWEVNLGVTAIGATKAITGATKANPCVLTVVGHGRTTNDTIQVESVVGMTQINDKMYLCTVIDPDHLSLQGVDSSAYTDYASGGVLLGGYSFYAAKQATAMRLFTSGNTLASDHWGAVGVAAMMDAFTPPFKAAAGGTSIGQRFGSGANQVLSEAVNDAGYVLAGLGFPKDSSGIDGTGVNLFGKDYWYQYFQNDICLVSSGAWNYTAYAGIWVVDWSHSRSSSSYYVGWRCAMYPN